MLARLQQHWAILAQTAAWLVGLIGAFLIAPPRLWPGNEDSNLWVHLSQFLVAIIVGLFFVRTHGSTTRLATWRKIAIAAIVAGLLLFILYQILLPAWTCVYLGERVVQGETLSALGTRFLETHPGSRCSLLIAAATGVTTDLWPLSELMVRYISVCAIYTLAMLSFSVGAMATIEFVAGARDTAGPGEGPRL